jgi:hypothetical protein
MRGMDGGGGIVGGDRGRDGRETGGNVVLEGEARRRRGGIGRIGVTRRMVRVG